MLFGLEGHRETSQARIGIPKSPNPQTLAKTKGWLWSVIQWAACFDTVLRGMRCEIYEALSHHGDLAFQWAQGSGRPARHDLRLTVEIITGFGNPPPPIPVAPGFGGHLSPNQKEGRDSEVKNS